MSSSPQTPAFSIVDPIPWRTLYTWKKYFCMRGDSTYVAYSARICPKCSVDLYLRVHGGLQPEQSNYFKTDKYVAVV
ncbi:hypothetical protein BGW80DRAFT_1263471 [Lactifluus volemus]|nr:hypothetical protein BGW80DRAFT_1263471 [Lactifluus volemus]